MRDLDLTLPGVLDASLVVSASAGSGKTFTLSVLVTAGLGRGDLRPYDILATTFGEAAASDLRERLLRPLDLLALVDAATWAELLPEVGAPGTGRVQAVLSALPLAKELRKAGAEVALAAPLWGRPAWTAGPAQARAYWRRVRREAELLQVSTIHSLALALLGQAEGAPEAILDPAHPALLRLLRQTVRERLALPAGHPDQAAAEALLAWAEANWERLSAGHDGHMDAMGQLDPLDPAPCRQALLAALAAAEAAFRPLREDPELAVDRGNRYSGNFKPESILAVPGAGAGTAARVRWALKQSKVHKDPDKLPGYLTPAFQDAYAHLQPVADAWEDALRVLLVDALAGFEAAKREHGQATFGDLVRRALAGLRAGAIEPPRPAWLLIDECQDTSASQDAFLAALGAGRTVRVGDLKQAIYGFRGGDPDLLAGHLDAAGEQACRLPANFRSAPPVVALANRFVEEVWPALDADAATLGGAQRPMAGGAWPVGLVRAEAPPRGTDLPGLGEWIAALSHPAGWDEALGAARPGPRRRALLLRQRTKLPALLRQLKRKGIQPYVVAKDGFWDSPGVRLVLAALEAVAHPERPAPCAALLRHLAGADDAALTALAVPDGLPGLADLDPARLPEPCRAAAAGLKDLRGLSTQALAGHLLDQGGLLAMLAALRAQGAMEPVRARRNLGALLARLLDLPANPVAAFALLEEERNGVEKGDLPAPADGADLVIQTVHGSKGLEYEDVLLPLLNSAPQTLHTGELHTDAARKTLDLVWKLGSHPGRAYRRHKPLAEARQRRDDLNLLYVAITRARERMLLLLQAPAGPPKPHAESKTWAQWGQHLAAAHGELAELPAPPAAVRPPAPEPAPCAPPPVRQPLPPPPPANHLPGQVSAKARQEGEQMHGYLQDLLVRWEDPAAFAARLALPPPVAFAQARAQRFLEQFEARGWRHLRRRTELPIAGAAASGAEGRADLVVWDADRIHLLDFKHSAGFDAADLELYTAQLRRYAEALEAREGLPVDAWLVPLKGADWVPVPV